MINTKQHSMYSYGSMDENGKKRTSQDFTRLAKPFIDRAVDKIIKKHNPAKIILFGSYARGTPDFHSDVDLLVVLDEVRDLVDDVTRILGTIDPAGIATDVIVVDPKELERVKHDTGYVYYYALKEGVTLYER